MSKNTTLTAEAAESLADALGFAAGCILEAPDFTRLLLDEAMKTEKAHIVRILIRFFTDLGKAHPEPRADDAAAAYVAQQHKEGTA